MNRRQALKTALASMVAVIGTAVVKVKTKEPTFHTEVGPPTPPPHRTPEQLWEDNKKREIQRLDDFIDNPHLHLWEGVYEYSELGYNRLKARMIERGLKPVLQIFDGHECIIFRGSIFTTTTL